MNNYIYREIEKEYEEKLRENILRNKSRKEKIFSENPKLQKLEDEKNMLALKITKTILLSDDISRQIEQENMNKKLKNIEEKMEKELKSIGYTKEDITPKYDCQICQDTGKIKENDIIRYCTCFRQKVINATYKQYNMEKLDVENFDTFDIGYYSNKTDKEKYGIERSPLKNIECIRKLSEDFIKNIDNNKQKNLLFVGNTGLGKTFLANCIANELIKEGKTVIYQTAPLLMDQVMEYKFNYNKTVGEKEKYNKIFDVDLLIIDDLGTETMSNNKFTELFNIINTRLLENKKILISTNLNLNELYNIYDERVVSRIIGNFIACKFIGEDIRLKKKKINA
jgi:DNA replication protein DnaC